MPKELAPGILYVSEKYAVAGHLCACGCGNKVITPLGPAEWSFTERGGMPSLWPSIGNWQLPCRSHYIINQGRIDWAGAWTDAQVLSDRRAEQRRREAYYASTQPTGILGQAWQWLMRTLRRLFRR
nr:DUF6527 family protein [Bradyrhizobium brasilense]